MIREKERERKRERMMPLKLQRVWNLWLKQKTSRFPQFTDKSQEQQKKVQVLSPNFASNIKRI